MRSAARLPPSQAFFILLNPRESLSRRVPALGGILHQEGCFQFEVGFEGGSGVAC